jgi:hypothetical protein
MSARNNKRGKARAQGEKRSAKGVPMEIVYQQQSLRHSSRKRPSITVGETLESWLKKPLS